MRFTRVILLIVCALIGIDDGQMSRQEICI